MVTTKDLVIFYPFFIQGPNFDYYTKRTDIKKIGFRSQSGEKENNELRKRLLNYNKFWVVSTQKAPLEKIIIKENYKIFINDLFRGVKIENYAKK